MRISDLFFPKQCLECKKEGAYICSTCLDKLSKIAQICPECGRAAVDGMTHERCRRPWGLDGLFCLWAYQGVIRKAILKLKYKFARQVADELADHIAAFLKKKQTAFTNKSVLAPIPLYWLRENWRGFNQMEEVGKLVAGNMGWEFQPDLLVRKRLKRPQTDLKKEEREKNVQGVFFLNPNYDLRITNYDSLILFDDVATTGSTLKEAAKVLKRNGISRVWGFTIAR